jgi:trigger factor
MVQEKTVEKLENSAVKLSITIPAEEVQSAYDGLVKKYAKSAQIKGFRKGKVPREILERKFGEGFRAEALQELVESGLEEVFQEIEERPLPYAQPRLADDEELELVLDKPLSFTVTYDTFPAVLPGSLDGLTVKEPKVKVTKKDEDREIEDLRQQNALVIDKENGEVASGDIVTITFEEVDEQDEPIAGTRREDFTFTIGSGQNLYHLDEELMGMKKDETRLIEKEYPADFEHEELQGQKKRIRVSATRIKERDVPALDDDFAQDVSDEFETLEDLRKDVRSRLEKNVENRVRVMKIDELLQQVLERSTVPIPESMVLMELQSSWQGLSEQYRMSPEQLEQIIAMQGKTREQLFEEWRPDATERIRRNLLVQKLLEAENVEVTDEDVEARIRTEAEERKADPEQVLQYYRSNNMLAYVKRDLQERKMFDDLLSKCTVKAGEKMEYVDVIKENR